jgi:hypothetical protein
MTNDEKRNTAGFIMEALIHTLEARTKWQAFNDLVDAGNEPDPNIIFSTIHSLIQSQVLSSRSLLMVGYEICGDEMMQKRIEEYQDSLPLQQFINDLYYSAKQNIQEKN